MQIKPGLAQASAYFYRFGKEFYAEFYSTESITF